MLVYLVRDVQVEIQAAHKLRVMLECFQQWLVLGVIPESVKAEQQKAIMLIERPFVFPDGPAAQTPDAALVVFK